MKIAMLQHIAGLLVKFHLDLSDDNKRLLCVCTRCSFDEEDVIFYHHEKIYISGYENL